MRFNFSRKIALRYLWSKRSEAFISIITVVALLGIAIGVVVLNMTMAIMSGFEETLREKVVGSTHILVGRLGGKIENWQVISDKVKTVPGVASVSAYTQSQALLTARGNSRGVVVRGVDPQSPTATEISKYLEDGEGLELLFKAVPLASAEEGSEARLPTIFVGHQLVRQMGLFVGEGVSLMAPTVGSTPFGLMPRFRRFVVAASYKSGLAGYEEALVYMGLGAAQQFFRLGEAISGLEVMVKNIDEAPLVARSILNALRSEVGPGFYAQDWTELNRELWQAIKLEKNVYFLVLLLIVVMASFSIVTTLVMIVLEKRKDIAVLKTLGASRMDVASIFFIQGTVIGALGTVLGLICGYLGCVALQEYGFPLPENVFPTSTVPVKIEFWNFVVVGISAFAIACLSTIYPAFRASRLEPSEVLRYE